MLNKILNKIMFTIFQIAFRYSPSSVHHGG